MIVDVHAIGEAAIKWLTLRDQCRALAERRGRFLCKNETEFGNARVACWKTYTYNPQIDDDRPMPRAEWCPSCLHRQGVHDELRALTPTRGAALRNLIRLYRLRVREMPT